MAHLLNWNPFRRNQKDPSELRTIATYGAIMGEAQRPQQEAEMMEQLNINIHIIEDEKLNSYLEQIATKVDEKGNPNGIHLDNMALRILTSKLIRSSWVDPIDVDIAQLEVERLVNRIEMNMDEDTYEYGGTNLLEAVAKVVQTAWSDAKGGRKAKLLKVTPRILEISMPEPGKKRESIIS